MTESQRDREVELMGVRPSRQVWTEDRRQAFLDIADRVKHSVIATYLGLTVRQITNFIQHLRDHGLRSFRSLGGERKAVGMALSG